MSHNVPMIMRDMMAPVTDAMPAFPMSLLVRSRLSLMMGSSGAAAKLDTKHMKNDSHAMWKALMWGFSNDHNRIFLALFSESTGISHRDAPCVDGSIVIDPTSSSSSSFCEY